ncbi:hypothetical protein SERLA73DRAFT_165554 [Serpula lacrymans var. lacrymans S7.3]|uniref:Uncharacterized protein n=2 Tax=Serpula lacrymans var. lacrymans TaxID=341189 RepID=F8PIU5_SERL3|nr:uncharacterized protein SERLADRAFT_458371 [Serpula lacrymans var. lacrymans S7.9]EGO04045.1 hypothetical protein SERLA73DRAFT_165554 [Serpula lacrymans var. lacrymans S7.3]EGO29963.1 hypothetical protein SERLADRAFT_458371 [Serpula lacrymans var. lacrymans S7.9]
MHSGSTAIPLGATPTLSFAAFTTLLMPPKTSNTSRIRSGGVFHDIVDVLSEIEEVMGLKKGEAMEMIQDCQQDPDVVPIASNGGGLPMLTVLNCANVRKYLRCTSISPKTLRNTPYNPHWRNSINQFEEAPPSKMRLKRPEIKDAECIF